MNEAVLGADVGDEQKDEDPMTLALCDRSCHLINFETGGPAALSGVMISPIDGAHGIFNADQVRAAIRPRTWMARASSTRSHDRTCRLGGVNSDQMMITLRSRRDCPLSG